MDGGPFGFGALECAISSGLVGTLTSAMDGGLVSGPEREALRVSPGSLERGGEFIDCLL